MIKKTIKLFSTLFQALAVVWIVAMGSLFAYIFRTHPIALLVIAGVVIALLTRIFTIRNRKPESPSTFTPSPLLSRLAALKVAPQASSGAPAKRNDATAKRRQTEEERRAEIDAYIAEMLARAHDPHRAKQKPAWALIMQSPFDKNPNATSWLGGLPVAPTHFEWPRDTDGKPLSFIAQIDLADVKPEATTGLRPESLPERGALLAFMGLSYAFRVISSESMVDAEPVSPPPDLISLEDHGFWIEETMFPKWPVTLVPFMDHGNGRPAEFPDRFKNAADWITNWGIAAVEAEAAIKGFEYQLRAAIEFMDRNGRTPSVTDSKAIQRNRDFFLPLASLGPALLEKMKSWLIEAQSHPPEAQVDRRALQEIMIARLHLKNSLPEGYLNELEGHFESVWRKVPLSQLREPTPSNVPDYLRPLIKARIEDWRGHRLMGLEPDFPNNSEDFRGHDCVLSIHSDDLLQTQTEHDYGFSMWCKREDIARGHLNGGQFIRHCAV